MEDLYIQNDEKFKIFQKSESEEKEEEKKINENDGEEEEDDENITIYNKKEFELENVIKFMFNKDIFEKVKFCPKCGKIMSLENNKN